jgi:hypothetical protein
MDKLIPGKAQGKAVVQFISHLYRVYKKKGNRTSARYYTLITRRMNNWFSYSERSGF